MREWDEREIATAWDLIDEAARKAEAESRGHRGRRGNRDLGAGGPQYSG